MPSWHLTKRAEQAHLVPSGHRRKAGVVEAVKVGLPNEYWLAQPLSTGSPNGPLVLARPTAP